MKLSDIQDAILNDAVKELTDESVFLGVTEYGGGGGEPLTFVGSYYQVRTNGGTSTFTYSNFTPETSGDTIQEGDLIICVFGRGNSSGYYHSNTPSEDNGNFDFIDGAKYSGNDTYDHDHAIFQKTVSAGETSTTFNPDGLGTDSYQACAFVYLVFRNWTGVDQGQGSFRNNSSRFSYTGYNSTTNDEGNYIVYSHAHGAYSSTYNITTASSNYDKSIGPIRGNDTDDINMSTWVYQTDGTTWTNPSFSGSSTTSSDSTLVSIRVY